MTVNINGTTGVSLIQTGAVPSGYALSNVTVSNVTFSGATSFNNTNVSITGTSSYLNINGNNVSPYSGMMKNRIINGAMMIDQRFAGAANNNIAGSQYVVDRWYSSGSAAGKLKFQQNNTNGPTSAATQNVTSFPNFFGANVVSSNTVNAGDFWQFLQIIEGLNIADLGWGTANAQPVTLSFWSYSSISGTHGGKIGNGDSGRSYPFTYTINTANTWQYQTITIPGDTTGSWWSNTSTGMTLIFSLGVGSTYNGTNNTWNAGNYYPSNVVQPVSSANGSFYLTGVQLEKGSQATAFDFRHYTTELQLCQRYFTLSPQIYGSPVTGSNNYVAWQYKVTMRAVPTITYAASSTVTSGSISAEGVTAYSPSATFPLINTGSTASAELGVQN